MFVDWTKRLSASGTGVKFLRYNDDKRARLWPKEGQDFFPIFPGVYEFMYSTKLLQDWSDISTSSISPGIQMSRGDVLEINNMQIYSLQAKDFDWGHRAVLKLVNSFQRDKMFAAVEGASFYSDDEGNHLRSSKTSFTSRTAIFDPYASAMKSWPIKIDGTETLSHAEFTAPDSGIYYLLLLTPQYVTYEKAIITNIESMKPIRCLGSLSVIDPVTNSYLPPNLRSPIGPECILYNYVLISIAFFCFAFAKELIKAARSIIQSITSVFSNLIHYRLSLTNTSVQKYSNSYINPYFFNFSSTDNHQPSDDRNPTSGGITHNNNYASNMNTEGDDGLFNARYNIVYDFILVILWLRGLIVFLDYRNLLIVETNGYNSFTSWVAPRICNAIFETLMLGSTVLISTLDSNGRVSILLRNERGDFMQKRLIVTLFVGAFYLKLVEAITTIKLVLAWAIDALTLIVAFLLSNWSAFNVYVSRNDYICI